MLKLLQSRSALLLLYILLGFLIFTVRFDVAILNTSNVDWLYVGNSDMVADMYSWEYYRYDTSGSLVLFDGMAWPHITSVGNTNIVPYWAVPLKLVAPWLPENFQHFGWFILSCYVLQSFFAAKLLWKLWVSHPLLHFSGVMFILLSPPFLDRIFHLALGAHWIILAALCVYFSNSHWKKSSGQYALLSSIAALTHPYLILFPMSVAAAATLRMMKQGINWRAFIPALSSVTSVLLSFYAVGMFALSLKESKADGFGYYSANLLTFISNLGKTNVEFLNIPNQLDGQYEGYAYLGAGVLVLYLLLFIVYKKEVAKGFATVWRAVGPLSWMVLALMIFATAFKITIGNFVHFSLGSKADDFLGTVFSVFRSSGRYAWMAHYLLLIFPLWMLQKYAVNNRKWLVWGVIPILFLQIWDVAKPMERQFKEEVFKPSTAVQTIAQMLDDRETVIAYPLYARDIGGIDDSRYFLHYWAPHQINITAGHLPRAIQSIKDSLYHTILEVQRTGVWPFKGKTALLTDVKHANLFKQLIAEQEYVYQVDNYLVITSSAIEDEQLYASFKLEKDKLQFISLKDYLLQYPDCFWLFASRDEASSALEHHLIDIPRMSGSVLHELGYRHSYCGIFPPQGAFTEVVKEERASLDTIVQLQSGKCTMKLTAFSGPHQDNAVINVCGQNYSLNARGLLVVIMDKNGKVVNSQIFDTYLTTTATLLNQ